jgi:hypothetical protein
MGNPQFEGAEPFFGMSFLLEECLVEGAVDVQI